MRTERTPDNGYGPRQRPALRSNRADLSRWATPDGDRNRTHGAYGPPATSEYDQEYDGEYGRRARRAQFSLAQTIQLPALNMPAGPDMNGWATAGLPDISQWPTGLLPTLPRVRKTAAPSRSESQVVDYEEDEPDEADEIDLAATWIMPVVTAGQATFEATGRRSAVVAGAEGYLALLVSLVKSSGIYALAALGAPLISLGLSPFLAHYLTRTQYGVLLILNTVVGLAAGVTQLGLTSAFFRGYSVDFSERRDRQGVAFTTLLLLCLVSIPLVILANILAPEISTLLFGSPEYGGELLLAAYVVLAQNLAVPGLAWPRATSKPLYYSVLSIGSSLVALAANIVLVGYFHYGISGALIATGAGYGFVALITIPVILGWAGVRFRMDIAWSLLGFGAPLVLPFISYWVLQLSDRYILSIFRSIAETASYGVAYTLGSAVNVAVITPFMLAWPTTMYMIAKRKDAAQIFRLVFRWLVILLLFAAYAMSLAAQFALAKLFPSSYQQAAPVIPVVAASFVFYGAYIVFAVGINIKRKTWMTMIYTGIAAGVNLGLNLFLIPAYGQMGAAYSTLIAYIVMALVAYIFNQRMYPIPFEMGRFAFAVVGGFIAYAWSQAAIALAGPEWRWDIAGLALVVYGLWLLFLSASGLLARMTSRAWAARPSLGSRLLTRTEDS